MDQNRYSCLDSYCSELTLLWSQTLQVLMMWSYQQKAKPLWRRILPLPCQKAAMDEWVSTYYTCLSPPSQYTSSYRASFACTVKYLSECPHLCNHTPLICFVRLNDWYVYVYCDTMYPPSPPQPLSVLYSRRGPLWQCFTVYLHLQCIIFSRLSAHGCLKFTGQKTGAGAYTEKPFVCITHIHTNYRIIKKIGGGHLHGDGRLLERIRYLPRVPVLRRISQVYMYIHVQAPVAYPQLHAITQPVCQ